MVASPIAAAFANSHDKVALSYDATKAPIVLTLGQLDAAGVLHGGFLAASVNESRIEHVPHVMIATSAGDTNRTPTVTDARDVTIVVHSGGLFWKFDNATASFNATATYAFGFALPQSPFDTDGAARSPALVLVGPRVDATVSWIQGDVTLVPLDATISILDASGQPLSGWDHRSINPHADLHSATGPAAAGSDSAIINATGPFDAHIAAQAIMGGLGASGQTMRVGVSASPNDLFLDTAGVLGNATKALSGGGSSGPNGGGSGGSSSGDNNFGGDALSNLAGISPVLNGAILVLNAPAGATDGKNDSGSAAPTEAKLGDHGFDAAPFALMRSQDLALAWGDGQVSVSGTSAMTLTKEGVSTTAPLVVGLVPIISVVLWLGAIAAIVFFFVKRPPKADGKWSLRLLSLGVYILVFVLAAWYWDHSFAQTFGTSVLTMVSAHGVSGVQYQQLALVFGLESIPWTLAAFLFAIPVRIILGIALRYRGEGSSFKRVAGAGGLVSLAIFGPLYALWIVNVLAQQIVSHIGGIGG